MRHLGIATALIALAVLGATARAQTVTTLFSFSLYDGDTGVHPMSRLTIDTAGVLYGTTTGRVDDGSGNQEGRQATVFRFSPAGGAASFSTLMAYDGFAADQFANVQRAGVTLDGAGNLYGTTPFGGPNGGGTVFRLTSDDAGGYTPSTLFAFGAGAGRPDATLLRDAAGRLYGSTFQDGTLFRLSPNGGGGFAHSTLATAAGFRGDLAFDSRGALYSSFDQTGGIAGLYSLPRTGPDTFSQALVYGGPLATRPPPGLMIDGADRMFYVYSGGVAWNTRDGVTQYPFTSAISLGGASPMDGLLADAVGNIFGTTANAAFRLSPTGNGGYTFTTLADVSGQPIGGLVADGDGNLYGTTAYGGEEEVGTIYRISGTGFVVSAPAVVASEPGTLALLAFGAVSLAVLRRRARPA